MRYQKLLKSILSLALTILTLVGCGNSPTEPTVTSTLIPPVPTATPIPPTATPTAILPPATPTPIAGIGVPIASGGWQITLEDARHEAEVSRCQLTRMPGGGIGFQCSTTNPASGFTFLVVETAFRNLNSLTRSEISIQDVTLIGENGKHYDADELSEPPSEFVFKIEESAINQNFTLHFRDSLLIPFSVEQEVIYPFRTEINTKPDALPHACLAESLSPPGDAGRLTFYRPAETELVLGYVDPNEANLTQVCRDIAFGDLQLAADGAGLLLVTPYQGWPSLYLIEPEGETYPLVNNGLHIEARFDPSGRWVLFSTEKIGETGRELYAFDRETTTLNLVQAGEQITFDFLTDGRLITNYRETEDSDRQYYVGSPDGSVLEPLELPEKLAGHAFVSDDGQKLVYREVDSSFRSFSLFISDPGGNNVQELAQSIGLHLYYALSPDSQTILMGIGEGEMGDRVELRNLASDESWTIADGIDDADFGFSADGQWATAITTVSDRRTLYIVHSADGSVREIDNAVNAFFAPDSTRLAYTVRQADGNLVMYVTSLEGEAAQSLGSGVLTGWFPLGIKP